MAKLKNPLLSLGAIGRVTKAITFVRRRKTNIVETYPLPDDPKTLAQLSWRHMYQKAVALWHALSSAEQQDWQSQASRRHMTGFAWFMSQALKPNPGLYLPLQGGTMSGDIDMAKNKLLKLPLPTDSQEAASKTYVDTAVAAAGYNQGARAYHNANQSIPNSTYATLAFNSERYDTDAIHDNATNNSRLTCKTAGKYLIIGLFEWGTNVNGGRWIGLYLNGTTYIGTLRVAVAADGSVTCLVSVINDLNINDYVELQCFQDSGGALNVRYVPQSSPEFMMQRIGA